MFQDKDYNQLDIGVDLMIYC